MLQISLSANAHAFCAHPGHGDIQLAMGEAGLGQVDPHPVESLALRFIDAHGEGQLSQLD